ncbi:hypothetical protein Cgig2_002985 [Carnegiea gigantea]|uniref:Uncharacterized protein n=1 Tax=Carnegiea gigantea TaxID=171969 RepID=A0A9Q1GK38_9CARY|nr:hypothetical protein Cgig2_002985 [Carnegiea gigantea]
MDKEITKWMPTELKKQVQALRETDAFKEGSEQDRKNKTTGPKARTLHIARSISASQWARRLANNSSLDMTFDIPEAQASQAGTEVDDDELFLQAVGGKNKKGIVYGLGTESEAYYPRSGRRSSPSSSYTPSVVSQMETRLKKSEAELQAMREELRAIREEQRQQRELIASLLAWLEGPSSSHSLPPPS